MNIHTQTLRDYTRAMLPWTLGEPRNAQPIRESGTAAHAERLLKAARRAPREHVLLLGFGDGSLASALASALPPERALTVCTLNADGVRLAARHAAPWWEDGRHCVLADASPRAHLLLLHAFGRNPSGCTLMLNPTLAPEELEAHRQLQRLLISTERLDFPLAAAENARTGRLSAAAILHPDEPDLHDFFAQFPAWLHELVVVWDADAPPASAPTAACPVRHLARRLAGDFAAQRNAALAAAAGEWIFFLDGDERLSADGWRRLPMLTAQADGLGAGGIAWPRVTFWPDGEHVLAGFGLWPDLQLRLLRAAPGLRFERPVHEVVTGVPGSVLIDAGMQIRHLSRLLKNRETLAAKLRVFDAAAGHAQHRLNEEYPTLPAEFMRLVEAALAGGLLQLNRL